MRQATIEQDDEGYVYTYCPKCGSRVGDLVLVPIGPLEQALNIMEEHNQEVHPS